MEEIYKNIYQEVFPLSGNPLKSINIFVIKTDDQNMIVDTGFNNEELRARMDKLIKDLYLDLKKTSLFITHHHSDHLGLSSYLEEKGIGKIYISEVDSELIKNSIDEDGDQWKNILYNANKQGLGPDNLTLDNHPGFINRPEKIFNYTTLTPGDKIKIGEFNFEVLDESGHTPGMIGLYEKEKGILFCGDHILGKITPNITYWGEKYGNSLGIYLENINKIKDLNIKHLFSSHRYLVEDVNKRIDELKHHHDQRLNDTLHILEKYGKLTTREVAALMKWDISAKNWDDFPKSQKWFASGEAASHLVHLRELGKVNEEIDENGVAYYSIV